MPCDYSKYPKEWPQIRARILERDEHRCVECEVKNYSVGYRELGEFRCYSDQATTFAEAKQIRDQLVREETDTQLIIIVLNCAHLENDDPMDCREENLGMLCPLHHLKKDEFQHRQNAKATRVRKKNYGQELLFPLPTRPV